MTTFAKEDRVCVKGGDDTIFVIKSFRTVEQAVCMRANPDKKGYKDGRSRFFNVDKLEYPNSHSKPRKWTKSESGGGQYTSSDGWLVMRTGNGTWIAQNGKVMSEGMKTKKEAYAWINEREGGK